MVAEVPVMNTIMICFCRCILVTGHKHTFSSLCM